MSARGWITLPRVFAALLILYAILEWGVKAETPAALLSAVLAIIAAILGVRVTRQVIRKSLWRLRNRLYVTWVFIGLVPIVLFLALAWAGVYIVTGQVAVYLVSSE